MEINHSFFKVASKWRHFWSPCICCLDQKPNCRRETARSYVFTREM